MDEELNHQAYEDIMDLESPRYPNNEEYMRYYRFWLSCDPNRFDPYGDC